MGTIEAINLLSQLMTVSMNALATANQVSALIQKAHAEGRDITPAELNSIVTADDTTREALVAAITAAGG